MGNEFDPQTYTGQVEGRPARSTILSDRQKPRVWAEKSGGLCGRAIEAAAAIDTAGRSLSEESVGTVVAEGLSSASSNYSGRVRGETISQQTAGAVMRQPSRCESVGRIVVMGEYLEQSPHDFPDRFRSRPAGFGHGEQRVADLAA